MFALEWAREVLGFLWCFARRVGFFFMIGDTDTSMNCTTVRNLNSLYCSLMLYDLLFHVKALLFIN